jgi:hypothetical protein
LKKSPPYLLLLKNIVSMNIRRYLSKINVIYIVLLFGFFSNQSFGQNKYYENNRYPLSNNAFIELPLGSISAEGWLKERLIRQRNGLTGHLDEIYPQVMGSSNGWLGGDGDQWERGPYWIDGLLPLAYILHDTLLEIKVKKWIEWTLNSQRKDGFFGPQKEYPNTIPGVQRDNVDDWWPRMVMLKVLQQYYMATKDERTIHFLIEYFHYQLKTLPEKPLDFKTFWGKYRGGDNLMVVLWLYNITGDRSLLDLADILYQQTFDFESSFKTANWWVSGNMHCVNLAEGLKTPAIYAQYKSKENSLSVLKKGFNDIITYLGYPHGGFGGDEALHGNNPNQGTEFCTLVEYMFSLEKMLQISGDLDYAEQIERIAFNALPAQSDDEYMNRQYFQQTNQIRATRFNRNFDTNHAGTDIVFGKLNGYPCCTSNMHQGYPKFVQNLWYATLDNGLAKLLYSPSTVHARVGNGTEVIIEEKTDYPFSDKIEFLVNPQQEVAFPIYLRIPVWCKNPELFINSKQVEFTLQNRLICINRYWKTGDKIQLTLPMEVNISRWYERSATVERGPLVYSLKMHERKKFKKFRGDDKKWFGEKYFEIVSNSPWNYALIETPEGQMDSQYKVYFDNIDKFPWNTQNAPITIKTTAVKVPNWKLYNESCGPVPYSIAYGMPFGKKDSITLIPYGCTKLRITEFPICGQYTIK